MLGQSILRSWRFWTRLKSKLFRLVCRGAFHQLGPGSVIQFPIRLSGESRISIGRGVWIGSNSWLAVIGRAADTVGVPVITIGDGASIAGFCTISAARSVVIEDEVLIARYVYIADHAHACTDRTKPILAQGITEPAPVRICRGAWLGQSVVICPGVTVGRGAVVGANSVVRRNVPDFCVAVGAPARVVREVGERGKG